MAIEMSKEDVHETIDKVKSAANTGKKDCDMRWPNE